MKKVFTYSPNPFRNMSKRTKKLAIMNAILIVSRDRNGKNVPNKEFLKRIEETEMILLDFFGGCTNDKINYGKFKSKKGVIIKEKIARIVCYAKIDDFKKNRLKLEKWLLEKKKERNQEKIGYEFEGDMYYI